MARLSRLLAVAAIVGLTVGSVSAQTPSALPARLPPVLQAQQARLNLGSIQGVVSDDRGGPLPGAIVSALGVTTAMATTDARGRFLIQPLAAGDYVLRVHLTGFVAGRREGVRVGPSPVEIAKIQMRRVDGSSAALPARTILTAGVSLPSGENATAEPDNHTETAWRLRHIQRSVMKQEGGVVSIADAAADQPMPPANPSVFGRAFDNAAGFATMAASFFTATPFTGEVNFLTTSALGAGPLLFSDFVPRGVAYMSIGAPAASGRWDVRASMSQSDLSAWVVAGSFASRVAASHNYGFGVSYSTQQYQSGTRSLSVAAVADDTRNVGEIYGSDRWTVSPTLTLDYGARYAHYDYLLHRSLLSPRVGFTLTPFTNTHVTATVAQRMLAPGAEEFLPVATVGPWLPPERTFAPLEGENFRVERARFYDVGIDHQFEGAYMVGVRRFQQRVDNQMATLFGLPASGGPTSPGHYSVANAGGLDAEGWGVRLSSLPSQRIRASFDYSVTRAQWVSRGDMAAIAVWAPTAIRPRSEDIHDLTTSLETDVPQTATRVFFLYKINNAFARGGDPTRPALDYRFDVQVNQALPFMPFSSTARWEVLVGLRNLFRDPADAGSVYDELLVVRPPKRVIGGVLIRF